MSRKRRIHYDDDAGVDMTPMLDIVFILLIFFIVTTSFVKATAIDANRIENKQQSKAKGSQISPGAQYHYCDST